MGIRAPTKPKNKVRKSINTMLVILEIFSDLNMPKNAPISNIIQSDEKDTALKIIVLSIGKTGEIIGRKTGEIDRVETSLTVSIYIEYNSGCLSIPLFAIVCNS